MDDFYYYSDSEDEFFKNSDRNKRMKSANSSEYEGEFENRHGKRVRNARLATSSEDEDYENTFDYNNKSCSQAYLKRAKRRLANRICARKIRQKKEDQMNNLLQKIEQLEKTNAALVATLTGVVGHYQAISYQNIDIKAELAFQQSLKATRDSKSALQCFHDIVNTVSLQ